MSINEHKYNQLMYRDVTFFDEKSLRIFTARPIDIVNAYKDILDMVGSGVLMSNSVTLNNWYELIGLPPTYYGWTWIFKPETDILFHAVKDSNRICIDFNNLTTYGTFIYRRAENV